jgi:peptide/nickel transport system permease protein
MNLGPIRFGSYAISNTVVLAILVATPFAVRWMYTSALWQRAWVELRERRGVVISAWVLLAYTAVALLDSVGGHPARRGPDGQLLRSADGQVIYEARGGTLLDLLLTPWRTAREKTYSAPWARRAFCAEFVRGPDGVLRKVYPPLKYPGRHPLGTDRVGEDVFYQALKGIRTAMILGVGATALAIPFALFLGMVAGYIGRWVDDLVQYIYTVLASIPTVLLVIAFMVVFGRGLPQMCTIMGITTWTTLCRIVRGETLKLREQEFVLAAVALGVPRRRILWRHILPNVMHLVIIASVLGFSGRVLSEAALTYMGIGVGVDTYSWGRMINDARMELARDPVVWWKLTAALVAMVGLVLPANVLGDALRDALDPRLRTETGP